MHTFFELRSKSVSSLVSCLSRLAGGLTNNSLEVMYVLHDLHGKGVPGSARAVQERAPAPAREVRERARGRRAAAGVPRGEGRRAGRHPPAERERRFLPPDHPRHRLLPLRVEEGRPHKGARCLCGGLSFFPKSDIVVLIIQQPENLAVPAVRFRWCP